MIEFIMDLLGQNYGSYELWRAHVFDTFHEGFYIATFDNAHNCRYAAEAIMSQPNENIQCKKG